MSNPAYRDYCALLVQGEGYERACNPDQVDGIGITTPAELAAELSSRPPGAKITIGYLLRGLWQTETRVLLPAAALNVAGNFLGCCGHPRLRGVQPGSTSFRGITVSGVFTGKQPLVSVSALYTGVTRNLTVSRKISPLVVLKLVAREFAEEKLPLFFGGRGNAQED